MGRSGDDVGNYYPHYYSSTFLYLYPIWGMEGLLIHRSHNLTILQILWCRSGAYFSLQDMDGGGRGDAGDTRPRTVATREGGRRGHRRGRGLVPVTSRRLAVGLGPEVRQGRYFPFQIRPVAVTRTRGGSVGPGASPVAQQ